MALKLRRRVRDAWTILTDRGDGRDETVRTYAFSAAARMSPAILAQGDRYRFLVSTRDRAIGLPMFLHGHYELDVATRAIQLLKQELGHDPVANRVFVDVGANIGTTSIPAVLEWKAVKVLAIEPSPDNFTLLRCNAILNGCDDRMVCVNAAVSDGPETVELALSTSNSGDNRVVLGGGRAGGHFGEDSWATVSVPARSLDSAIMDAGIDVADVGVVWVDTQGHEANVLASSTAILAAGVPMIVEYWPYGLDRASAKHEFHRLATTHFETIIDARTGRYIKPDDLTALANVYGAPGDFTDLLLIPEGAR